jgi:hypothetical protein
MKSLSSFLFLVICIIIQGCTASTHLGKATVPKPDKNEADEKKWFAYYEDQLDAYGGNAVAPAGAVIEEQGYTPSEGTYNQAAVDGYEQARLERMVKEKKVATRSAAVLITSVTAVCLLPLLILIPLLHNNNP